MFVNVQGCTRNLAISRGGDSIESNPEEKPWR